MHITLTYCDSVYGSNETFIYECDSMEEARGLRAELSAIGYDVEILITP